MNAAVPGGFGALSLGRITAHLENFIRTIGDDPILIGHSFGGLLVQLLLDRGVGGVGVAINPGPIGGILPGPSALRAIAPILARPAGWKRPYRFSRERFGRLYATGAPPALVDDVYANWVIPAPGMIFHQAAFWAGNGIDPGRRTRPLLITGSDSDRLISPYLARAAYRRQRRSPAPTGFHHFAGRSHLLIAEPGWEDVAETALDWARAAIA